MASLVEVLQQEVFALTQRLNNVELNVLPEVTNRVQVAFNTIDAAAADHIQRLKDNLDEAKRNIDPYEDKQDDKWNLAHNDLSTRFADYEVKFQEAQVKFTMLADLLTEVLGGITLFLNVPQNRRQYHRSQVAASKLSPGVGEALRADASQSEGRAL